MKNLLPLLLGFLFFSCNNAEMDKQLSDLQSELTNAKTELAEATTQLSYTPGLIHNVFFWLKEDISEADKSAFLQGVHSLKGISTIRKCFIGPPAPTEERGVVDNSYNYALLVHFDDVEGQNAYQVDPIHLKFVDDHKDKWTKVIVYDNMTK